MQTSTQTERMQQQRTLERDMVSITRGMKLDAWFRDSKGTTALDNPVARRLMDEWLPMLTLAFEIPLTVSGNRTPAVARVRGIDPMSLAYMTLHAALSRVESATPFTKMARSLGMTVEREIAVVKDEALQETIEKRTKGKSGYVRDSLAKRLIENHPTFEGWSNTELVEVGSWALGILDETLGILKREVRQVGKDTKEAYLVVDPSLLDELDELVATTAIDGVHHWPMIVPPRRWEGLTGGPYLTGAGNHRQSLIRGVPKATARRIQDTADLQEVCEAVNLIQETPWSVNKEVLEVIQQGLAAGIAIPKFDGADSISKPDEGADGRAWAKYFRDATALRSNRRLAYGVLETAERFAGYSRIYFPHNLDKRGRAYPIPTGLSPQGNDTAQGLLTFADARPLGDTGRYWLGIYGANLYGVDKVSFVDRLLWTEFHGDAITGVRNDPLSDESLAFWTKADKPYQFLAFCFEWYRVDVLGESKSSLPVKMDATCSGIQHLSAMARDPSTGRAVNLLDGDTPSDVYGDVAAHMTASLQGIMETSEDPDEQLWSARWTAYGVDRKTTKRATMTLPYGSTQFSARQYLYDDLEERVNRKGDKEDTFEGDLYGAAVWATKHLWESINATVPGARETMNWLQGIATRASKVDSHVEWTTPDGFLVVQDYREPVIAPKKLHYLGKRIHISVATAGTKLDSRRQRNGMAPNFVHSMDAAALRAYVRLADAHGITAHSVIHDSFGTHAGDVELMQQLIRRSFVDMYQGGDPTISLVDWLRTIGAECPAPLADRGLDIREVLTSKYFFS